jgi:tellurite resistance protein TerA
MTVSLQKGQSVSLAKKNNKYSNVSINLKWNQGEAQPAKSKGFFGSLFSGADNGPKKVDLDLGCLYEMKDGNKHVVQALGNLFGSLNNAPYIQLANDDRTGASKDGEFLTINGEQWDKINRVLVFAYIYNGVSNWNEVDGIVHLKSDVSEIDIAMDNPVNGQNMCAIALIENINGEMKITKLNEYYPSHREMDVAHGWNMNWTTASK